MRAHERGRKCSGQRNPPFKILHPPLLFALALFWLQMYTQVLSKEVLYHYQTGVSNRPYELTPPVLYSLMVDCIKIHAFLSFT